MADPKPKGRDARLDFRVLMPLMIRYRAAVRREDGRWQVSPFFNGVGVDFSGGGSAFKVAKEIPGGTLLYLEISVPYDKEPVQTVAEVLRQVPDTLKDKPVFRCIVRYVLIHPEAQDRMVGFFINAGARQGTSIK